MEQERIEKAFEIISADMGQMDAHIGFRKTEYFDGMVAGVSLCMMALGLMKDFMAFQQKKMKPAEQGKDNDELVPDRKE